MAVAFGRLFFVQLCSAMCKGAMVSQFSPDLIQLAFYYDDKQEFYNQNRKTINSIMSLAPQLGQFTGAMLLPLVKERLRFRHTSLLSLVCIIVFQAILVVPMSPYAVFAFIYLSGVFVSINATIVLIWVGELADKRVRGVLGTIYELFCGIGQTVCSLLLLLIDYLHRVHESRKNYYSLTFLPAVIEALLCSLFLRCIPDEQFAQLPDITEDVAIEASVEENELAAPVQDERSSEITFRKLFNDRTFRKILIIAVLMGVWQEPSGINGVCQYATRIFAEYFDSPLSSAYGQIIINGGKTVFTIPSIFLIEHIGRKVLIVIGVTLCCSGLLLVIMSYTINTDSSILKAILLAGFVIYLVGFELGPGPCNHVLNSEIYPRVAKGKLSSIQQVLFYICNCGVVSLFEIMSPAGGEYIPYACYLACLLCTTTPLLALIPETKNRTNIEIESHVLIGTPEAERLVVE